MANHGRSRLSGGLLTAAFCISVVILFWIGQRSFSWPTCAVPSTHRFSGHSTASGPGGTAAVASGTDRPLITYVYSESQEARRNLEFFIAHGLHAEADFVFILNGVTDAELLVPDIPGVRSIKRDNTCYDLGSHAEVLQKDDLWRRYDRFILMNASVRGPFMPAWADGLCWTERLLSKITQDVKLVGISLNCWPTPHVQSMVWATDREGLSLLLHPPAATSPRHDVWMEELFTHAGDFPRPAGYQPSGPGWAEKGLAQCFASRQDAVEGEIAATGIVLGAGRKVDTLLTMYQTEPGHDAAAFCGPLGAWDPQSEGNYGGGSVHPFETIFIKTNRGLSPELIESLTRWTDEMGYSSYSQCSKRDQGYRSVV